MKMKNYKIIFIDMDGTLLDDNKKVSVENMNCLRKFKDIGIYVVLTSGRPSGNIEALSHLCNATPYLIASNGAFARDFVNNIDIFSKAIEKDLALKILKHIKDNNFYKLVTVSGSLIADEIKFGMNPYNRKELIPTESIKNYLETTDKPILKFTVIDTDKEKLEKLRFELLNFPNINVLPLDIIVLPIEFDQTTYCLDIMPLNITKAEAIKELLKYLKIDASDAIAIGDGNNDVEMFQSVGYKIALENSVQPLKDIADMITKSNNNSGVAFALNELFFNK